MSSSRSAARLGVVLGGLGVLAVPAGVVAAQALRGLTLLRGLYYGVPAAILLACLALLVSRRARFSAQRTVFSDRRGPVRAARFLAWLALYVGVTGAIALAAYWVFRGRH